MRRRPTVTEMSFGTSFLDLCSCALGGLILLMVLLTPRPRGEGQAPDEPLDRDVEVTFTCLAAAGQPITTVHERTYDREKVPFWVGSPVVLRYETRTYYVAPAVFQAKLSVDGIGVFDAPLDVGPHPFPGGTLTVQRRPLDPSATTGLDVMTLTVSVLMPADDSERKIDLTVTGQTVEIPHAPLLVTAWNEFVLTGDAGNGLGSKTRPAVSVGVSSAVERSAKEIKRSAAMRFFRDTTARLMVHNPKDQIFSEPFAAADFERFVDLLPEPKSKPYADATQAYVRCFALPTPPTTTTQPIQLEATMSATVRFEDPADPEAEPVYEPFTLDVDVSVP